MEARNIGVENDRVPARRVRVDASEEEQPADTRLACLKRLIGRGGRISLEYVTFGQGSHYLLQVVVLQFVALFLDVGLVEYLDHGRSERPIAVTVAWTAATLAFCCILATLVRQMGRRTLAPRFHRPIHLVGSVSGYLLAASASFAFGYATIVVPIREPMALHVPDLLPGTMLAVFFATLIAVGYHSQMNGADRPRREEIFETIAAWIATTSWVDPDVNPLERRERYEAFLVYTVEVADLLGRAQTVEGKDLEADFRDWFDRFEAHSMQSQAMVIRGELEHLSSDRLAAEHRSFVDLRNRLKSLVGRQR